MPRDSAMAMAMATGELALAAALVAANVIRPLPSRVKAEALTTAEVAKANVVAVTAAARTARVS